jgi:predicted XRE-type DNA-binding protein
MKRKHLGSKFEDLLAEDGILEECRASAIKFKIARELAKAMNEQNISKAEIAKRLHTSRTGVDRLLDPENTSITLKTMAKVASLVGKRIEFSLR